MRHHIIELVAAIEDWMPQQQGELTGSAAHKQNAAITTEVRNMGLLPVGCPGVSLTALKHRLACGAAALMSFAHALE